MPTYAYACTECDHRFEQHQAFIEPALTQCPQCSGRLRKVFNSVGIVFKGSGFYRTDSRKESAPAASATSPDAKGSEAKVPEAKGSEAKGSKAKTEKSSSAGKDSSSSSANSSGSSSPASGTKSSAA